MEPLKNNSCRDHPYEQKEFFCLKCKWIYCERCYKLNDRSHKPYIRPLSDELLGRYEFVQFLGATTYGSVFRVISLSDDIPCVIKVIDDINNEDEFLIA